MCTIKGVPSLLAVKLLSGLGPGLFHAIFAFVAEERFFLSPAETGLVMSFVGGLTMLSQVPRLKHSLFPKTTPPPLAVSEMTALPKVDTNCTAPSLIYTSS